jgi:thiol:disulfide interchange protein
MFSVRDMMKALMSVAAAAAMAVSAMAAEVADIVCEDGMCYPVFAHGAETSEAVADGAGGFDIVAAADGYMGRDAFLRFLGSGLSGENGGGAAKTFSRSPLDFLAAHGLALTLLVVFLAGMALNLTPCVLPMIPVQLALLGAGAGVPRGRGFSRGLVYGSAMALGYGIPGALVARSGGFLGTLQSSPWFNLGVAVLFVVLALALFDVILIDFSRHRGAGGGRPAGVAAVFAAGVFSALLAGSCVAPALIAVILLSGTLYSSGHTAALAMPLVLGLGMGFPWPFIAAGLSRLPRPGAWMVRVKRVFGVIVVLLAIYYANIATAMWGGRQGDAGEVESIDIRDLPSFLAKPRERPLLLDFRASWCRSCAAMERTTLSDKDVMRVIDSSYDFVRIDAEKPAEKETARILRSFGVIGVPAWRVIRQGAAVE